ncbi:MAG TPA: hypothetical protein QGH10_06695 [Armatimonadota bacterium]|nr:hypothetical protein [Armatimonadota bacterium]
MDYPVGIDLTNEIINAIQQEDGVAREFYEQCLVTDDPNFEVMLQQCDALSASDWGKSITDEYGDEVTSESPPDHSAVIGASELGTTIRRKVIEAFSAMPGDTALDGSPWLQLIPALSECTPGAPPRLFTTNYDIGLTCLESRLGGHDVELLTGFRRDGTLTVWDRAFLSDALAGKGGRTEAPVAAYMPLHGLVSWDENASRQTVEHFDINGIPLLDAKGKTVIWPAIDKLPFKDPFWCHHEHLVGSLQQARALLIIGYGFRDTAIMSLIRLALRSRAEPPTVVVWDCSREAFDERATDPKTGCFEVGEAEFLEAAFQTEKITEAYSALMSQKRASAVDPHPSGRRVLTSVQSLLRAASPEQKWGLHPGAWLNHSFSGRQGEDSVTFDDPTAPRRDPWPQLVSADPVAAFAATFVVEKDARLDWAAFLFGWKSTDHWAALQLKRSARGHTLQIRGAFGAGDLLHETVAEIAPEQLTGCGPYTVYVFHDGRHTVVAVEHAGEVYGVEPIRWEEPLTGMVGFAADYAKLGTSDHATFSHIQICRVPETG